MKFTSSPEICNGGRLGSVNRNTGSRRDLARQSWLRDGSAGHLDRWRHFRGFDESPEPACSRRPKDAADHLQFQGSLGINLLVIPEGGENERKIPGNPQWLDKYLLNRPIERQTVILEIEIKRTATGSSCDASGLELVKRSPAALPLPD